MKSKKLIITILTVLTVLVIAIKGKGLLKSRQNEIAKEPTPATSSVTVHLVKPTQKSIKNQEPYLAQIVSDQSINLSTKLAGFIQKVFVVESDVVKKGQPLLQIDSIELRSNIDALKANLSAQKSDIAVARSIYNTNKKLYRVGGLSREKLDLSRVGLNAKTAMIQNTTQKINQANHQLSYLSIKAPFDGVVDALLLHEGDLAAAGKPILSLSNGGQKLVFSYAPTKDTKIKKDKVVSYDGKPIGVIKTIYTTSKNGLIRAEVALDKPLDLPIGSSVSIDVLTSKATGCSVPEDSILHKKDSLFVLEYKDKKFTPLAVTSQISDGKYIIISPCPKNPIAKESEVKLAKLPAFKNVNVLGANDE
jgi:RND family efflux transporter MFP subunit